jgi:hypothetical protein
MKFNGGWLLITSPKSMCQSAKHAICSSERLRERIAGGLADPTPKNFEKFEKFEKIWRFFFSKIPNFSCSSTDPRRVESK